VIQSSKPTESVSIKIGSCRNRISVLIDESICEISFGSISEKVDIPHDVPPFYRAVGKGQFTSVTLFRSHVYWAGNDGSGLIDRLVALDVVLCIGIINIR